MLRETYLTLYLAYAHVDGHQHDFAQAIHCLNPKGATCPECGVADFFHALDCPLHDEAERRYHELWPWVTDP